MCESEDHVTLSRRCSERVYNLDLACLLKAVAIGTDHSPYLLHLECCWTDHGASPSQAVAGRPLMCEGEDHVTLSWRYSVRVSRNN